MQANRRSVLKGMLVAAVSLMFPITSRTKRLTDVDRIVLRDLYPFGKPPDFVTRGAGGYVLSTAEVDERLVSRMSIQEIAGVRIKVLRNQPTFTQHGYRRYISYYHATYNDGIPPFTASRGCWLPADEVDQWVERSLGLGFASRRPG